MAVEGHARPHLCVWHDDMPLDNASVGVRPAAPFTHAPRALQHALASSYTGAISYQWSRFNRVTY
jgi:hypothetical protein